jgi:hypothetical protein
MTSIKCDQPGCEFVAKHHRATYCNCIIARHKSIIHGIKGKSYKYSKKGVAERESGKSQPEAMPVAEPLNIPNFCPNCGCSISAIMAAMNLRRRK